MFVVITDTATTTTPANTNTTTSTTTNTTTSSPESSTADFYSSLVLNSLMAGLVTEVESVIEATIIVTGKNLKSCHC